MQPHVVKELPLPEEPLANGYAVLQDALVYLGDRRDCLYRMLRVRLPTGKEIVLLQADLHQAAVEFGYRLGLEGAHLTFQ